MPTDKFKNKYRIASARLQNWDYGWAGAYFITTCTKNREPCFGVIDRGRMDLSNLGVIADVLWYEIKNHAKNIELGEFVVMPNHVHGILILHRDDNNDNINNDITTVAVVETGHALSLRHALSLQQSKTIGQKRFQNIGENTISSIVGSYKSAVTKHSHRLGFDFAWQSRFYDHIIRDEKSYNKIANYIVNNPAKWANDKFNAINELGDNHG